MSEFRRVITLEDSDDNHADADTNADDFEDILIINAATIDNPEPELQQVPSPLGPLAPPSPLDSHPNLQAAPTGTLVQLEPEDPPPVETLVNSIAWMIKLLTKDTAPKALAPSAALAHSDPPEPPTGTLPSWSATTSTGLTLQRLVSKPAIETTAVADPDTPSAMVVPAEGAASVPSCQCLRGSALRMKKWLR